MKLKIQTSVEVKLISISVKKRENMLTYFYLLNPPNRFFLVEHILNDFQLNITDLFLECTAYGVS